MQHEGLHFKRLGATHCMWINWLGYVYMFELHAVWQHVSETEPWWVMSNLSFVYHILQLTHTNSISRKVNFIIYEWIDTTWLKTKESITRFVEQSPCECVKLVSGNVEFVVDDLVPCLTLTIGNQRLGLSLDHQVISIAHSKVENPV